MTDVVFLPGIVSPASVRYAPLLARLPEITAHVRELAVYAGDAPPRGYSIATEVDALARIELPRFHLYGHSGGGACALAFAAEHPERLLSLAIDEPASDHSEADHAEQYWQDIAAARGLPDREAMAAFLRAQLATGVPLPPQPEGAPPPWMARRPAGMRAFAAALYQHRVDPARYRAVRAPVLYTYGSLSHPHWAVMGERLAAVFPDFRAVCFEGLHHLHTSHQAEPARTAELLRELWHSASRSR